MIALLVLGANSPETLGSLIGPLDGTRIRPFLHVDARLDLPQYLAAAGGLPESLTVLDDRVVVYWGGWSMVEATIALMRRALDDPRNEILTLVSDDTAMLYPPAIMERRLGDQPLRMTRREPSDELLRERYERAYCLDMPWTAVRVPAPVEHRWIDNGALRTVWENLSELERIGKAPVTLCHGPQWWAMDRTTAEYVLGRLDQDRHLRLSFTYSAVPDENCIQTVVAERHGANSNASPDSSPMLFDFSRQPKPFLFGSVDEVTGFIASSDQPSKLFVRKVAPALAAELSGRGLAQ